MLPLRQAFRKAVNAPALYAALAISFAGFATVVGVQGMNANDPGYQAHKKYEQKQELSSAETRLALAHANLRSASMVLMLMAAGAGWMWERKRAQRAQSPDFIVAQQAQAEIEKISEVEAVTDAMHEGTARKLRIKPIRLKPEVR